MEGERYLERFIKEFKQRENFESDQKCFGENVAVLAESVMLG